MYNSYLISYEVDASVDAAGRGRSAVLEELSRAIRSYDAWARITDSTWAISSERTVTQVRDGLLRILRQSDRLIVVQSAHVAAWSNTICNNEWLRNNI